MPKSSVEAALSQRLGIEIGRLRAEKGLSQEALAADIGISTNHLQLLESGLSDRRKGTPANPRFTTLVRLSTALDVDLAELIRRIAE
ncbi:helix-turn-helix transcriptional regulator [Tsukamurella sp. NPDC003166]|uniref:helix-turn-helix domain-containing protein n=1 Tax=Tsukamurella sp. NPDC003166 TaxID=3154444 RepID=UPI0033A57FAA